MEEVFKAVAGYLALANRRSGGFADYDWRRRGSSACAQVRVYSAALAGRLAEWIGFAVWLVLGLEFELGADVISTAISRTWTDIAIERSGLCLVTSSAEIN